MTRWCRSQLPWLDRPVLTGMTSVDLARALISLPLEDRLAGRFFERFVAARAPAIALKPRQLPPPPARPAVPFHRLNLARHRRRAGGAANDVVDPAVRARWRERPGARAWVVDEALEHPLIAGTMGSDWVDSVRAGFLEGRVLATALALRACGPVRLESALRRQDASQR